MTSSDCFFTIGKTHKVCQDYAISSSNNDYVILSDGCSTAPDTDIGARLLVMAARTNIRSKDADKLMAHSISKADSCIKVLGISPFSLCATLLIARRSNGVIETIISGDGVIAGRLRETGELFIYEYQYPSGAPFYLNYTLDDGIEAIYTSKFEGSKKVIGTFIPSSGEPYTTPPLIFPGFLGPSFNEDRYDLVAIMSDGVASFSQEGIPISMIDVIQELMAFKNYQGDFVQRRCTRAFTSFKEKGWVHADDVSVAAIYVGGQN